jgi:phage/plasmid-associated DNA primase
MPKTRTCDPCASATETYPQSEDAILAWIEDRCVRDVDSFTTTSALFSSWSDWASKNREPVGTMKALQAKIEKRGSLLGVRRMGAGSPAFESRRPLGNKMPIFRRHDGYDGFSNYRRRRAHASTS